MRRGARVRAAARVAGRRARVGAGRSGSGVVRPHVDRRTARGSSGRGRGDRAILLADIARFRAAVLLLDIDRQQHVDQALVLNAQPVCLRDDVVQSLDPRGADIQMQQIVEPCELAVVEADGKQIIRTRIMRQTLIVNLIESAVVNGAIVCANAGKPPCSPETISSNPLAIPPTFIQPRERRFVRRWVTRAELMGGCSYPCCSCCAWIDARVVTQIRGALCTDLGPKFGGQWTESLQIERSVGV